MQLLIHILSLALPDTFLLAQLFLVLFDLVAHDPSLGFQLAVVRLQIGLRLLNLSGDFLKLRVILLEAIKLKLLGMEALAAIFVLVKEFFLVSDSLVTFVKVALGCGLILLDLISG